MKTLCVCLILFAAAVAADQHPLHVFDAQESAASVSEAVQQLSVESFLSVVRSYLESSIGSNEREVRKGLIKIAAEVRPVQKTTDVYWWYFKNQDCGYDDVTPICTGQTIDQCKALCLNTTGCGGFNYPHGILKKQNCLSVKASSTVDLYVVESTPQPAAPTAWPPVWPYPAEFTNGTTALGVNQAQFTFKAENPSDDLNMAFARYTDLFFPHTANATATPANAVTSVVVSVADVSGVLQLETNESYVLEVPADGSAITITAPTVFGAFHGLETLSQLIVFNFDTKTYSIAAAPWNINDYPRFAHREVLIDTARHFEPVVTLKKFIESMPFGKINVMHWHLTDSQSFPFDSPTRPNLAKMGAYSDQERYTTEDVADVVEHARRHGVRVMVEIDTPGHAAAMCGGYPDICPSTSCLQPLSPVTNETFEVLYDLFGDLTGKQRGAGLFPDNMMHLGGDEVDTTCWSTTPAVQAWMTANNLTTDTTYEYMVKQVQEIAHAQGRDVVGWEEIWDHFGTQLDITTVIHQWIPGSIIAQNATAHGYRVLWSTDGVWYLDGLGVTWQTMYSQEPCTGIADDLCVKFVLGGGGEMWGETVDTSDLQQTVWPRLGAIGERLWSPRSITDLTAAEPRFAAWRCLLNRRGVAAAPYNNPTARSAPPGPGSCYDQ